MEVSGDHAGDAPVGGDLNKPGRLAALQGLHPRSGLGGVVDLGPAILVAEVVRLRAGSDCQLLVFNAYAGLPTDSWDMSE